MARTPPRPWCSFCTIRGLRGFTVAPYRYLDAAVSDAAVGELLAQMLNGEVDAIAFTSKVQVERLFAPRRERGTPRASASAVAAVGPIVAAALEAHGVVVGTMPDTAWFLKPLTAALIRTYGSESPGTDPSPAC